VLAGGLLAWAMVGTGFANYDTAYSLLWGADLAAGRLPDYSVPVAPTPHPLATLLGFVLSPFGDAAEDITVVLAFLFLGALAWVVFALGREFFGVTAGVVAAVIILTREPVLSFGVRAYLDVPYVVLVLAALLTEARAPSCMKRDGATSSSGTEPLHERAPSSFMKRDGATSSSGTEPLHEPAPSSFMKEDGAGLLRHEAVVLVLLGLAGLLRPEAWLFAAAYVLWKRAWSLLWLAAAAPVVWVVFDWVIAGDPLYSLTGTRDNAEVLQRRTGLDEVPLTVPRRLGEILREPVLLGAAIGGVMVLRSRGRPLLLAGAGVVALAAFCVLAAAGLPILGRYLLLPAAVLAIFCGAAVAAWRDPRWRIGAAVTVVALIAFMPRQVERIDRLYGSIGIQREIRDDLHDIAPRAADCAPYGVPNHRAVPLLALWLDVRPREIASAQLRTLDRGSFFAPASERVERNFILDRNDPGDLRAEPPAAFRRAAANRSWILSQSC
jgi:hypothetical protein